MSVLVTSEIADGVAVITVDNPPVNALSTGVPEAILAALETAEHDPAVQAIVLRAAGRTFVAGADITSLEEAAWGRPEAAADLHEFLQRIEDCGKPVVVAIHGTALGGGLELAMAGHYRVAAADAVLGQPEVNLGIIPGAEGTQRLPRLVGVEQALEMCVTGRPIKAPAAHAAGLVDALAEGDLAAAAVGFAREAAARPPHPRTRDRRDRLGSPDANAPLFDRARELAARVKRRQTAPLKAIEAIEAATRLTWEDGCRRERELFFECVATDQARALIHVFFAERAVARVPGLDKTTSAPPVSTVGIVGAGTMGGGISMACANAGLQVVLCDTGDDAIERGLAAVRRNYDVSVQRGRLTPDAVAERLGRIRPSTDPSVLAGADLIVEAVFENMALKKDVFGRLDSIARPGCILATNTSTLDIDEIAGVTSRPDAVVGLHFFSPAQVMRLVEVVRGARTSPATLAAAIAFAKRLGKIPVVVGNCRGFVGNRMMFPYMYEAQFLVEEGATPEQVDAALTGFGMAMGIFAVDDMAGIDVACRVRQELKHFADPGERRPLVQNKLFELGRLGQKTGRGWYLYDEARRASPDPEVVDLIRRSAAAAGIAQRSFTADDIVERTILALVNEGARVLEEGFAQRASDIDVIYVNGYGFPAWRGGPMFYADTVGLSRVYERVHAFHEAFGARWEPAPLLASLARSGRTFRDYDRGRA